MIVPKNDTLHNIPKFIELGIKQEPQFPHLGIFYICEIQFFLRKCWLNTTINFQQLADFICAFLI